MDSIVDVEYHVSRANMERLLKVGCLVIQPYKNGKKYSIRVPFSIFAQMG